MREHLLITFVILVVLAVIVGAAFLYLKKKKMSATITADSIITNEKETDNALNAFEELSIYEGNSLIVEDTIPLSLVENRPMMEITDKKIVNQIVEIAPNVGKQIANYEKARGLRKLGDNIKKANEANQRINDNQNEKLYRVVINVKDKAKGAKLFDSKGAEGAKRAIYKIDGQRGIAGNAELIEQGAQNAEIVNDLPKAAQIANAVNMTMDVAAMVVGQYYMSEINKKLERITSNISKILLFQETEYKSKVDFIREQLISFSNHYVEIMGNESIRTEKLDSLKDMNQQCAELLGQANEMIDNLTSDSFNKYDDYTQRTLEIEKWWFFRNILLEEMCYISQMTFAFNKGEKSFELCCDLLQSYVKKCNQVNQKLNDWHREHCEHLKIDFDESRYKKAGASAFFSAPISLFFDDFKYKKINDGSLILIENQMTEGKTISEQQNPFEQDVEIVIKDGKPYYLAQ